MKKFFLLLIVFALFIAESYAQAGPGEDDLEETDVPIGGIEYMIAIAIMYGVYKVYKMHKQQSVSA